MSDESVIYNGIAMQRAWVTCIQEAQQISTYLINGKVWNRIRYGKEQEDWGADHHPCGDCGVLKGQFHVGAICDVERCPCCDGQVISCDCEYEGDSDADLKESSNPELHLIEAETHRIKRSR